MKKPVDNAFIAVVLGAFAAALGAVLVVWVLTHPKTKTVQFSPEAERAAKLQQEQQEKNDRAYEHLEKEARKPEPSPAVQTQQPKVDPYLAITRFPEAVKEARFADSRDTWDDGSVMFAVWAHKRLVWDDVSVPDETSHARVMKDSDAERRKRACWGGTIIEIAAVDAAPSVKVYVGEMVVGGNDVISFMAVGDTGDLVARSAARFCGVVAGRRDYQNSAGGVTHTVAAVGLFSLPANKERKR